MYWIDEAESEEWAEALQPVRTGSLCYVFIKFAIKCLKRLVHFFNLFCLVVYFHVSNKVQNREIHNKFTQG